MFARSLPCAQWFVTFQNPNFDISDPDTRAPIYFFFNRTLVKLHFSEKKVLVIALVGFILVGVWWDIEIFCHFGPRWWIFVSPISFWIDTRSIYKKRTILIVNIQLSVFNFHFSIFIYQFSIFKFQFSIVNFRLSNFIFRHFILADKLGFIGFTTNISDRKCFFLLLISK